MPGLEIQDMNEHEKNETETELCVNLSTKQIFFYNTLTVINSINCCSYPKKCKLCLHFIEDPLN